MISCFLYEVPEIKKYWHKKEEPELAGQEDEQEAISSKKQDAIMEKQLENFLVGRWESTEFGKLYDLIIEGGEPKSQQYPTDIGPIDLLVKDKKDDSYVVIELKKGKTSDDAVGQLARYMGWVKQHLANGKTVGGIIVAHSDDDRVKYALLVVPNTSFYVYEIDFSLEKIKIKNI